MAEVVVEPAALERTAADLRRAAQRLVAAGRSLRATTAAEAGDAVLASALDGFLSHWSRGLEQLAEAAEVDAATLEQAAGRYADLDAAIAGACS